MVAVGRAPPRCYMSIVECDLAVRFFFFLVLVGWLVGVMELALLQEPSDGNNMEQCQCELSICTSIYVHGTCPYYVQSAMCRSGFPKLTKTPCYGVPACGSSSDWYLYIVIKLWPLGPCLGFQNAKGYGEQQLFLRYSFERVTRLSQLPGLCTLGYDAKVG